MTKTVLPPCSIYGCPHAAGAIINERLLCGDHASAALRTLIDQREQNPDLGFVGARFGFDLVWTVEDSPHFNEFLQAIDETDRQALQEHNRVEQAT